MTVETVHRRIRMFQISEEELDRLLAGYTSMDQVLFGLTGGGLISFGIVFLTAHPEGNALSIAVALFAVSALGALLFGWRTVAGMKAARADARRLKEQASL